MKLKPKDIKKYNKIAAAGKKTNHGKSWHQMVHLV